MKKQILFLSIAFSALAVSCSEQQDSLAGEGHNHSIVATVSDESITKAVLDKSTNSISWELGDRIAVDGATYQRVGETNVFDYYSGGVTTASGQEGQAFYPVSLYTGGTGTSTAKYTLPSAYSWDKESGKVDFIPMAGKVMNYAVTFQPLTSLFKINVKNESGKEIKLCSVTLTSTDKPLGGDFTPVFDANNILTGLNFSEGGKCSKALTINIGGLSGIATEEDLQKLVSIEAGGEYSLYLPVPAAEYSALNARVTAVVQDEEGHYKAKYCNSLKQTAESAALTCYIGKYYEVDMSAPDFQDGVSGSGTLDDPFVIGNVADLGYIGSMVNSNNEVTSAYFRSACYKLSADITVENWTETMGGASDSQIPFSGVFDGDGHTLTVTGNNTKPVFSFVKDAVIKNIALKGDFNQLSNDMSANTFSPFFFAGQGRTTLVCVMYDGKLTSDKAADQTSLSVFGAVKGDPYLVGAYAKAGVQGFDNGDFGQKSSEYSYLYSEYDKGGDYTPYYTWGASAEISDSEPTILKYFQVAEDNSSTVSEYEETPSADQIADELNGAVLRWNNFLKFNPAISETDYERMSSDFSYKVENGVLELTKDNN